VAGIERIPAAAKKYLEPCAKIHGSRIARDADIAEIARAISRGNVDAPAQRDGEMCKIAADPGPLLVGFRCRSIAPGMVIAKLQSLMNIVANGLNSLPSTLDMPKQRPSEIAHLLGVAIVATKQINDCFVWEQIDIALLGLGLIAIGHTAIGYDDAVMDF